MIERENTFKDAKKYIRKRSKNILQMHQRTHIKLRRFWKGFRIASGTILETTLASKLESRGVCGMPAGFRAAFGIPWASKHRYFFPAPPFGACSGDHSGAHNGAKRHPERRRRSILAVFFACGSAFGVCWKHFFERSCCKLFF